MPEPVSVAIPTKNAGPLFDEVLAAVRGQRTDRDVEIVVCDSGSRDGTLEIARRYEARVIEISPNSFGHGRTRNLLMERTHREIVLFLTQDATPADFNWLETLAKAIESAEDVAVGCGPYLPRPDASPMVAREFEEFFASLSPDGGLTLNRAPAEDVTGTDLTPIFHTDANAVLRRSAWRNVPFRDISYAEDQALCLDLVRAGWAHAFEPAAPVIHSHDYGALTQFRRFFDEFRALNAVHGIRASSRPTSIVRQARRQVARDRAWAVARDPTRRSSGGLVAASLLYHLERGVAAAAGTRADAVSRRVRGLSPLAKRPGTAG